jgi:hypothetical protein
VKAAPSAADAVFGVAGRPAGPLLNGGGGCSNGCQHIMEERERERKRSRAGKEAIVPAEEAEAEEADDHLHPLPPKNKFFRGEHWIKRMHIRSLFNERKKTAV